MGRKHAKVPLTIIDRELWEWAKYRASILGFKSVSGYIFDLIKLDKNSEAIMERELELLQTILKILDEIGLILERFERTLYIPSCP